MKQKCHFIGIGGIGMSGLAHLLLKRNVEVTGSDIAESLTTQKLVKAGAKISIGHSAKNIVSDTQVVYSSDIKEDNVEFQKASEYACKMIHRSDLLFQLMEGYKTLAVTGTHGKTTTTSLLTTVFYEGGKDPSFAVGGILPQFDSNSGHGNGQYFIAEADESDGTFLKYHPFGAIVTNIDLDHMNYFKTEAALLDAFSTFIDKVNPANLFWCLDDSRLYSLQKKGRTYGFSPHAEWHITHFRQTAWQIQFDITHQNKTFKDITVALTGKHNALNATAVFGLAFSLGVSEEAIRKAFLSFQGVKRRCEKVGETKSVLFLDDYAHHPTEIEVTLKAIRQAEPHRRLIAVFQPHRYSRMKDCLGSFGGVFDEADELFVTDIYASRETPIPDVTVENLMADFKRSSRFVKRNELSEVLAKFVRPHDIVVTLGAGDVTRLGSDLIQLLDQYGITKYKVGVIFGGRSSEAPVSVMSSKFVFDSLLPDLYEVESFSITKKGQWIHGELRELSDDYPILPPYVLNKLQECDILFPMMHGKYGEDGTMQGFLDILDKPYVGPDHAACAITMDKSVMKSLCIANGILTSPFIEFTNYEWKIHSDKMKSLIDEKLTYPVYVKGPHLGSSIAVKRVANISELDEAVENVLKYDTKVLVENEVLGREIEFAVIGNDEITVFDPSEVFSEGNLYDYHSKYSNEGIKSIVRADLPQEAIDKGKLFAKRAYQLAGCAGFSRVDTFYDDKGRFWMSEINPLPGCTEFSLFPKMCEAGGMGGSSLINQLLILGLSRKRLLNRVL